jgi:hypothetical protein
MSDLLASLVDRALDRAPVLRRRQPTLFEPVVEAAFRERSQFGNAAPLPEEETLVERAPSPGQRKSDPTGNPSPFPAPSSPLEEFQPQHAKPGPKRQRRAPDVNPLRENDRENARGGSVPTATVTESPANPIAREEQPSRGVMPRAIAKQEEITVAAQRLIETIVERRVEREIISEHLGDTSAIEEAHSFAGQLTSRDPSRDHEGEPVKLPLKAEVKPLSPPKEEMISKPLTQKKPAPRRDTAPVIRAVSRIESTRALPQPTPPTIHVTIGRVEVRATPQATARPLAARPTTPRMSLEDYLRSRGEGK